MLTFTVYNQSGGQKKSTTARDIAAALAEIGKKSLIIDMDSQNGSVSNYLGVDDTKKDPDADSLSFHLIEKPQGDFDDLIRTAEPGIDVIPSHKRMSDLDDYLDKAADFHSTGKPKDWEYPRYKQLLRVLKENNIRDRYDAIIIDPNAKADDAYYMSLYATRNVLVPAVPTRTGLESIEGVKDSATNFAKAMDIDIGLLGVFPVAVDMRKSGHKEDALKIKDKYDSPIYTKSLSAFENAERAYQSIFAYLKNKDRIQKAQQDIMPKYRTLVASLYATAGKPLPRDTWDEDELYWGDDWWGDLLIEFEQGTEAAPSTATGVQ